jgi:hypothetical protein
VYGIIVDATGYPVKPGMFSTGYAVLFPGNRFTKQRVILCPGGYSPAAGGFVALHQIKAFAGIRFPFS